MITDDQIQDLKSLATANQDWGLVLYCQLALGAVRCTDDERADAREICERDHAYYSLPREQDFDELQPGVQAMALAACDVCGCVDAGHTCCDPEPTRFVWTVEIEVSPTWVADGLDLTPERLHDLLTKALPYVRMSEIAVRAVSSPDPDAIAHEQGYKSAAHKRSVR